MSDSSLLSQPDNVPPMPPRKERRAGAALASAPDSNRFSGLDIAVVALLIGSLIVSVTIIPTRGFSRIFSVGWDLLLWYLPERLLFAPVWVNIVALFMYVRKRDQAGIVASLVPAAAYSVSFLDDPIQASFVVAVALFPVVVALILSTLRDSTGVRLKLLGVAFSRGVSIMLIIVSVLFFFRATYGVMGLPGWGLESVFQGALEVSLFTYVIRFVELVLGVGVVVVSNRRRYYAAFVTLTVLQALVFAAESVVEHQIYIGDLIVLSSMAMVWSRPVRQWFSSTWSPGDVPVGHAPAVVPVGMPAAVPSVYAQGREILGADGRMYMAVPIGSSLSESAAAQGVGGDTTPLMDVPSGDVDVSARAAAMLPSTRTTFWISFFFGLFGLIPMMMGNSMARNLGVVTNSYNREFLKGWLIGVAVWGGLSVLILLLVYVEVALNY
jgi:membrane protein